MDQAKPEEKKKGEHPATNFEVRRIFGWLTLQNLVGTLAVLGVLYTVGDKLGRWYIGEAIAQDGGVERLKKAQDADREAFREHLKDDAEWKRRQEQRSYNLELDARELYKVIRTGQPSERLATPPPPPPAPAPDGGR